MPTDTPTWIRLFGKLLKGHLLKYDQLKLKYYKLHESEIVINSALIIIIFYLNLVHPRLNSHFDT